MLRCLLVVLAVILGFPVLAAAQGLLSGCVVGAGGTLSGGACAGGSVPDGWTLVRAQGFESGYLEEDIAGSTTEITQVNPHTGSFALRGDYTSDGDIVAWVFNDGGSKGGQIGPYTTLYISYWDYIEPQGLYANSDYSIIDIINRFVCGAEQNFFYGAQFFGTDASTTTTTMLAGGEGSEGDMEHCQPFYQYDQGTTIPINAGYWRQNEIFYHPSTTVSTGDDCDDGNGGPYCHGDGESMLILDGVLFNHEVGRNLNGTADMSDPAIWVGGVITSFSDNTFAVRCAPFNSCPGPEPGTGAPASYKRYIDDIIIMKQ